MGGGIIPGRRTHLLDERGLEEAVVLRDEAQDEVLDGDVRVPQLVPLLEGRVEGLLQGVGHHLLVVCVGGGVQMWECG